MTLYRKLGIEALVLGSCLLLGASMPAKMMSHQDQQTAPDNSKANQNTNAPTADQQKMNPADRDLTKKIRMALHDDQSLSMYAHNIKIISQDGKVTLRGPVRSEEEKAAIEAKAVAVAGDGNVTNHLHVAPPKS
ncbi:MAG: BON domain-containing protein [Candidatus Acidiferrum sp.]|jgi:hyperosmotically inducible periplasmic protein